MTPEARARTHAEINRPLTAAGWHPCDLKAANIHAARSVAIREFQLNPGHGKADYLLYMAGKTEGGIFVPSKKCTHTQAGMLSSNWGLA